MPEGSTAALAAALRGGAGSPSQQPAALQLVFDEGRGGVALSSTIRGSSMGFIAMANTQVGKGDRKRGFSSPCTVHLFLYLHLLCILLHISPFLASFFLSFILYFLPLSSEFLISSQVATLLAGYLLNGTLTPPALPGVDLAAAPPQVLARPLVLEEDLIFRVPYLGAANAAGERKDGRIEERLT
jgi:hypothetical protein